MTRQLINGVPHCKYGHAIEGDNRKDYIISGETVVKCLTCQRDSARAFKQKHNENVLPADTASTMLNYKEPLTVVENGFGHYGTLVVDEATQQFTQCHICGLFVKHLGHHVKTHKMSAREYRIQFSLPLQMPLRSAQAKSTTFGRWAKLTDEEKKAEIARLTAASRKRVEDGKTGIRTTREMLYKKNLNGNCPDQLLDKIMKLAETLGRTPSLREFRREYDGVRARSSLTVYTTRLVAT